ncbi:MAG: BON domain-containing protein [Gemmatimonadota bacterium]
MRSFARAAVLFTLALTALACGGGDDAQEPDDATTQEDSGVLLVADSIIQRELTTRLEADPRLADPGVQVTAHADHGDVTLIGRVPSRMEMSIAREVAASTPGVRTVYLDSLVVESEAQSLPVTPEEQS